MSNGAWVLGQSSAMGASNVAQEGGGRRDGATAQDPALVERAISVCGEAGYRLEFALIESPNRTSPN